MRKALITIVVLLSFLPLLSQTRIAYIDSERLRKEYKEFSEAQAQYDKEVESWQKEAEAKKAELEQLEDEYDRQSLLLSEDKRKEMEMRIKDKRKEYEEYLASLFGEGGRAMKRNAELTQPLLAKINTALQELAQSEHIEIILDIGSGAVAYARPELDLTQKLLDKLNKTK